MTWTQRLTERRELEREARRAAQKALNMRVNCTPSKALRRGNYEGRGTTTAAPKENVLSSAPYEVAVRKLPCARCGIIGFSQFCHTDQGKGMGLKTDVRRGWAGCGPHGNDPGCHWLIGTSGRIPRERRREIEAGYAAWTRTQVLARGWWPAKLPMWTEQQGEKA